jgi:hypothetical protein
MDKRGANVPEASNGSRVGNLLAGLGKFAIDSLSGKRELMLARQKKIDSKTIDLGFRGLDAELDKQRIAEFGPLMESQNITDIGPNTIRIQKKGPQPKDAPTPKSDTPGDKPKGGSRGIPKSGRQAGIRDTEKAVKEKRITQEEGTYISKGYAAKVGRKAAASQPTTEDVAPENATSKMKTPAVKKPTAKKPSGTAPKKTNPAPKKPKGPGNVGGYSGNVGGN